MPEDDLIAHLKQRCLDLAIDYSDLQAVMYIGRTDAFPVEIFGGVTDQVKWPIVESTSPGPACPVAMHCAIPRDCRVEVVAHFGDEAGFQAYRSLARAAIESTSEYASPDGHALSERRNPEAAWTRWLFDVRSTVAQRYMVAWHSEQAKKTATSLQDQAFDPFNDDVPATLVTCGYRQRGCLAWQFPVSVFKVSAEALGRVNALSANDHRDKWLYEQCCARVIYKTIKSELRRRAESDGWDPIESIPGIKRAAERYAESHNLPPIPKRQRGRPSKK